MDEGVDVLGHGSHGLLEEGPDRLPRRRGIGGRVQEFELCLALFCIEGWLPGMAASSSVAHEGPEKYYVSVEPLGCDDCAPSLLTCSNSGS